MIKLKEKLKNISFLLLFCICPKKGVVYSTQYILQSSWSEPDSLLYLINCGTLVPIFGGEMMVTFFQTTGMYPTAVPCYSSHTCTSGIARHFSGGANFRGSAQWGPEAGDFIVIMCSVLLVRQHL